MCGQSIHRDGVIRTGDENVQIAARFPATSTTAGNRCVRDSVELQKIVDDGFCRRPSHRNRNALASFSHPSDIFEDRLFRLFPKAFECGQFPGFGGRLEFIQ